MIGNAGRNTTGFRRKGGVLGIQLDADGCDTRCISRFCLGRVSRPFRVLSGKPAEADSGHGHPGEQNADVFPLWRAARPCLRTSS